MKYLMLFLFVTNFNTFASYELDQFFKGPKGSDICQDARDVNGNMMKTYLQFIKADNKEVYFVFYRNRTSVVSINDLNTSNEYLMSFEQEKVVDILIEQDRILFLTPTKFVVVDRQSRNKIFESATLPSYLSYGRNALATGVKRVGDRLYVSHGIHGVTRYDAHNLGYLGLVKPKVTQPQPFHISAVTGLEIHNNILYMAMDDVTLVTDSKAFEGLVLYDLKSKSFVREIPVNQRREAYYKPRLYIEGDELFVTNLNLIFRHRINQVYTDRYMNPYYRIWKYPNGELVGRSLILNEKVYGCFHDYSTGIKSADVINI